MTLPSPFCKRFLMHLLLLGLLLCTASTTAKKSRRKTIIEKINTMHSSWMAGPSSVQAPKKFAKRGPKTRMTLPILTLEPKKTPTYFNSRTHWIRCSDIISRIRNQGYCDSGWAVATASMLSDRTCIETGGAQKIHLSAEHLLTCCDKCRLAVTILCAGGNPQDAIEFWTTKGIVTGGEHQSKEGCKPYTLGFIKGIIRPDCKLECTNSEFSKTYQEDRHCGGMAYKVPENEGLIRQEIFFNGPVVATMTVYRDLIYYQRGVYQHLFGNDSGVQHVKIIGWGITNGYKYWLVANSLGTAFGNKGTFKIIRGINHCRIEENVLAARTIGEVSPRELLVSNTFFNGENTPKPLVLKLVFLEIILIYVCTFW